MNVYDERRRFPRLGVDEQAVAFTSDGVTLGSVTAASGGGMQLENLSAEALTLLQPGKIMQITILEPGNSRSVFRVEVRYLRDGIAGFAFVSNQR